MSGLMTSTEHVIAEAPFTIRRRVKWGECDPAGVAYTVTFAEYVMSAAELFYGFLLGSSPQAAKQEHGFGTPTGALKLDFRRSLRPDEEFDITVRPGEIRARSYVLLIEAHTPQGELVFSAELTPICVARHERRAIELPASFRMALEQYRDRLNAAAGFTNINQQG
jgi:acyl-CoA thioester hydrolase